MYVQIHSCGRSSHVPSSNTFQWSLLSHFHYFWLKIPPSPCLGKGVTAQQWFFCVLLISKLWFKEVEWSFGGSRHRVPSYSLFFLQILLEVLIFQSCQYFFKSYCPLWDVFRLALGHSLLSKPFHYMVNLLSSSLGKVFLPNLSTICCIFCLLFHTNIDERCYDFAWVSVGISWRSEWIICIY